MPRLSVLKSTLKRLFALTGNRCAFAECEQGVVNQNGESDRRGVHGLAFDNQLRLPVDWLSSFRDPIC